MALGFKEVALGIALTFAPSQIAAEATNPRKMETTEGGVNDPEFNCQIEKCRLSLQKALSEEDKEKNGCEDGKQEVPILRVIDGDTIDVDCKGKRERIRIIGVNTPETVHPLKPIECFGKEASNKMKGLLQDKKVIIKTGQGSGDRDKYGRLLRYVELNGEDVGAKMIREGFAFSYRKYPHERLEEYNKLERQARENGVGLWAEGICDDFTPPPKPEFYPVPKEE